MSYKPPVVKEAGARGDAGPADLTWGDTKVKIEFEDGTSYKVLKDELPEYCQEWTIEKAYVSMKGDNESVLGIRPLNGVLEARFNEFFVASKDDEPSPTTKKGQYGSYQYFIALVEVVKGKFKGAIYPVFLNYKFGEMDEITAILGEGKAAAKLADFLDCTGAWDDGELAYSDNVLPALQKRMKRAKKTFQIIVKGGQVETTVASDFETDDEEPKKKSKDVDEEEDEKPSKKSSKKSDDDDL